MWEWDGRSKVLCLIHCLLPYWSGPKWNVTYYCPMLLALFITQDGSVVLWVQRIGKIILRMKVQRPELVLTYCSCNLVTALPLGWFCCVIPVLYCCIVSDLTNQWNTYMDWNQVILDLDSFSLLEVTYFWEEGGIIYFLLQIVSLLFRCYFNQIQTYPDWND